MFVKEKSFYFVTALLLVLLYTGCSVIKNDRQGTETSAETTPGLQPIDIRFSKIFLTAPAVGGTGNL
jgi:hypothetical protein